MLSCLLCWCEYCTGLWAWLATWKFPKEKLVVLLVVFLFVHLFWFLRLQEGFYVYCEIIFNVPLSPALLKRRLVLEHTIKLLLGSAPTWMHFCGNVGETDHEIACMC